MKLFLLLAVAAAVPFSGFGQQQAPVVGQRGTPLTRTIEGTVLDRNGAAVSGAVVLLKDMKTLQVRSYIASKEGKYHFFGLSSDINYQLRAQANGMTSGRKDVSVFDSHQVIKLDLKLKSERKK